MLQKMGSVRRGLVAAAGVFALGAALMAAAPAQAGDHHHSSFFFGFGFPVGGYYGPSYYAPAYAYPPPYAYGPAYAYAPPAPQYQTQGYCREFQTTIVVDGQPQDAHGTACQQPDGSWQVMN
jgi:hypothetical protein